MELNVKEIRQCFEVFLLVVFGKGFGREKVKSQSVPCLFCGGADGDGHHFRDCTFPPVGEIREHPEFHGLGQIFIGLSAFFA